MAIGAAARARNATNSDDIVRPGLLGGSADKPVGTVWFAWRSPKGVKAEKYLFSGDRAAIRDQAIKISLEELLHQVTGCNTVHPYS